MTHENDCDSIEQGVTKQIHSDESCVKTCDEAVDRQQLALNKEPKDRTFDDLGLKLDNDKLSEFDKKPFKDLIEQYSNIFALSNKDIGKFNLYDVELELKEPNPPAIKTKLYPQSQKCR